MSELLVNTIKKSDGSGNITVPSETGTVVTTAAGSVEGAFTSQIGGRRNIIINGAMQVAQRGTSTSVGTNTAGYSPDRFRLFTAGTTAGDVKQVTTVPSGEGFAKSLQIDVTTADSTLAAGDAIGVAYRFEGQDLQQLRKGSSNAKSVTLSFWVRSSKTGTHIAELYDNDNTRAISKAYTISTADTWEYKTITYAGDTSGSLDNDNLRSMTLNFWLGSGTTYSSGTLQTSWGAVTNSGRAAGQVNVFDSASNNWYITGVQLEVGDTATPFEHRSYGEELAACMRYCYVFGTGTTNNAALGTGFAYQTTWAFASIHFPVEMRATPTLANVGGSWEWSDWHVSGFATGTLSFGDGTRQGGKVFSAGTVSGLTDYRDYFLQRAGGNPTLTFDAEL